MAVSTLAAPSSSAAFLPALFAGMSAIEVLEAFCAMYSLKGVAELGVEFFASHGGGIGAVFPKQDTVVRVLAHEPGKTAQMAEEVVKFEKFAEEMAKKGMSAEEARKLLTAGKATEEGLIIGARIQQKGGAAVYKSGKNLNKLVAIPGLGTLLKCADLVKDAVKFIGPTRWGPVFCRGSFVYGSFAKRSVKPLEELSGLSVTEKSLRAALTPAGGY